MKSGVKWRAWTTAIVAFLYFVAIKVYDAMQGPIEGSAAVGQLSDDPVKYAASREVAVGGLIPDILFWASFGALVLLWGSYLLKRLRTNQ